MADCAEPGDLHLARIMHSLTAAENCVRSTSEYLRGESLTALRTSAVKERGCLSQRRCREKDKKHVTPDLHSDLRINACAKLVMPFMIWLRDRLEDYAQRRYLLARSLQLRAVATQITGKTFASCLAVLRCDSNNRLALTQKGQHLGAAAYGRIDVNPR